MGTKQYSIGLEGKSTDYDEGDAGKSNKDMFQTLIKAP